MRVNPLVAVATSTVATLAFLGGAFGETTDPFAGLPSLKTTAPKGATINDGDNGVEEQRGAATYTFPIEVPPGRNGMAPSLALSYSSQASLRGGIAVGWSGPDLPYVEIEPRVHASEVKFRLNGSTRLVRVVDALAGASKVYRAEFDAGFTRWELWGATLDNVAVNDHATWRARNLDGSYLEFTRPPSPARSPGLIEQWRLSAQVDTYGNRIDYHWDPVELNSTDAQAAKPYKAFELSWIEYSSNTNLPAHARVEFHYADAPRQGGSQIPVGAELSWTGNPTSGPSATADGIVAAPRELQSITTHVRASASSPWTTVRKVSLGYFYSDPHKGASLRYLETIDVSGYRLSCAGSICQNVETKAPTITFTYGDTMYGTYYRTWSKRNPVTFPAGTMLPLATGASGAQGGATTGFLDMNSDGSRDFVSVAAERSDASGKYVCTMTVYPSKGDGSFDTPYKLPLPTTDWENGISPTTGHVDAGSGPVDERCTLGGQHVLYSRSICRSGAEQTCCSNEYQAILGYHFLDYDGDGRLDLLTTFWRSAAFRDRPSPTYKNNTTIDICHGGAWSPQSGECECAADHYGLGSWCSPFNPLPDHPPAEQPPTDPGGSVPGGPTLPGLPDADCNNYYALHPETNSDGTYLIRAYTLRGGRTLLSNPVIHSGVALPPPGEEGLAEATHGAVPFTLQTAADVDGNGYIDLIATPVIAQNPLIHRTIGTSDGFNVWLGSGGQGFDFQNLGMLAPHFTVKQNAGLYPDYRGVRDFDLTLNAGLHDINGDGRPDLVYRASTNGHLIYFPNTGGRFAVPAIDLGYDAPTVNTHYHVTRWNDQLSRPDIATRSENTSLIDVDGDGRPDLVQMQQQTVGGQTTVVPRVSYNLGDRFSTDSETLPSPWLAARAHFQSKADNTWATVTEFADVNGDGLIDLVDWDDSAFNPTKAMNPTPGRTMTWATDEVTDAPVHYLRAIDNGRGALVEYTYQSSTALGLGIPMPTWVVTKVKTTPDAYRASTPMVTTYAYASPNVGGVVIRDSADFHSVGFKGFERVTVNSPAPAGQLHGASTVHVYAYGGNERATFKDVRGYKVGTYGYDGYGVLQAVERNAWEEVNLFGSISIVRPTSTERHTCTVEQQQNANPETACGDSTRNMVKSVHSYQPYLSGTQVAFFQDAGSMDTRSDDPDRVYNTYATYKILYPTGAAAVSYRMLPLTQRTTRRFVSGGRVETTSRSETVYDANNFPTQTKAWWSERDSDFVTTVRTFDTATGNVLSVQKPVQAARRSAAPGMEKKTTYDYDAYKLYVAVETNELGHKMYTTRDLGTAAVTRVQGPQSVTVRGASCSPGPGCLNEADSIIDGFGRVIEQKATYNFGTPDAASTTLVSLATTVYDDLAGTVTESHVIDPSGGTPGSVRSVTQYDGMGRVISQDSCRGITSQCPDPANDAITTYVYDGAGLLSSTTIPSPAVDGANVTYSFTHDSLGRLTRLVRPGNQVALDVEYAVAASDSAPADSANGLDYGFTFQKSSESGVSNGSASVTRYDLAGNLVAVQECSGLSCAGMPSSTQVSGWDATIYEYDDHGRLVEVTDADGNNTWMEYDLLGRRTSITHSTRQWRYEYDYNGNMVAEISPLPAGVTDDTQYRTTTSYDDLDRPVRRDPARRGLTDAQQAAWWIGPTNYFYDEGVNGVARLTRVEQPRPASGAYAGRPVLTVGYTYDGLGRMKKETRTFNTTGNAADDLTQSVVRTSNALGASMFAAWDDGQYTATSFDALGKVKQVTYTGGGTPTLVVADYGLRNRAGAPTKRTTGPGFAGQERAWTYDEAGRVLTDRVQSPSSGVLMDRTYTFDPRGELQTLAGTTKTLGTGNATRSFRTDYTYDRAHRVATATEQSTHYSLAMTYSGAGNILSARVSGVPVAPAGNRDVLYRYDGFDPQAVVRLEDRTTQRVVASMSYDDAGNMTTRSWPLGEDLAMSWDGDDQLRQARTPDGSYERYAYDQNGQRIWALKDSGADAGVRYWFGESETFVAAGSPTHKRRYIYVGDGGGTLARAERQDNAAPSIELNYSDALQDLVMTTSITGSTTSPSVGVNSWFFYGAFAEVLAQGGESNHRREFNGKEVDATTGLRYYGARYYDPLLMRWASGDPLYRFSADLRLEDPARHNLYAYTLNKPVRLIDPDGRDLDDKLAHAAWATGAPIPGGFTESQYQWHLYNSVGMQETLPQTSKFLLDSEAKAIKGAGLYFVGGGVYAVVRAGVSVIAYIGVRDLAIITVGGAVAYGGHSYMSSHGPGGGGGSGPPQVRWTNHGNKHVVDPGRDWKEVVKSTSTGPAKYRPGTNVERLERAVWDSGTKVTNGKNWKVAEFNTSIGASEGEESRWIRVECSGDTIHGHPISKDEYKRLLKPR